MIKIPELEAVEKEMAQLVDDSKPEGSDVTNSPTRYMAETQRVGFLLLPILPFVLPSIRPFIHPTMYLSSNRVSFQMEYERLIITLAMLKIELGEMQKRIRRNLEEAGIVPSGGRAPQQPPDHYYSFLESS